MRIEYVVVGFVLAAIILFVAISMLKNVIPGVESIFNLFGG
ncbi:MAG: hypothetical protein QXD48_01055 [Candidatus Aenigmatarchaeota archaeon]